MIIGQIWKLSSSHRDDDPWFYAVLRIIDDKVLLLRLTSTINNNSGTTCKFNTDELMNNITKLWTLIT